MYKLKTTVAMLGLAAASTLSSCGNSQQKKTETAIDKILFVNQYDKGMSLVHALRDTRGDEEKMEVMSKLAELNCSENFLASLPSDKKWLFVDASQKAYIKALNDTSKDVRGEASFYLGYLTADNQPSSSLSQEERQKFAKNCQKALIWHLDKEPDAGVKKRLCFSLDGLTADNSDYYNAFSDNDKKVFAAVNKMAVTKYEAWAKVNDPPLSQKKLNEAVQSAPVDPKEREKINQLMRQFGEDMQMQESKKSNNKALKL